MGVADFKDFGGRFQGKWRSFVKWRILGGSQLWRNGAVYSLVAKKTVH
jgi:hypothetical protein